MLRGPGQVSSAARFDLRPNPVQFQKASDPFQFVATKGGEEMAETAKSTLHVAQQQKVQREKILRGQRQQQPKFEDSEPWQADLDTWRRKRKEKIVEKGPEEKPMMKYGEEYASYSPRKVKDEVLQINSSRNHQQHSSNSTSSPLRSSSDDLNDSGIDNRTVETPSTSEFSPRSTDLFSSPKSLIEDDEEPPQHPPPPPPPLNREDKEEEKDQKLDQVLIPLKFKKQQQQQTGSYYEKQHTISPKEDHQHQRTSYSSHHHERNAYTPTSMPINTAAANISRVEATFKQPPPWEGVKPFVSRAATQESHRRGVGGVGENDAATNNVDVTVELNREQKATITATKYPRTESHETPAAAAAQPLPRIYRAVDIPLDDDERPQTRSRSRTRSTAEKTFRLNILMGSQPVHKGLGFTTHIKEEGGGRSVLVESVIVGSPADRAGLLVGDTVLSINGEEMTDKYQSGIQRMLHEAARIGEADVMIARAPVNTPLLTKQSTSSSSSANSSFDRARSVFTETNNKSFDSYAEFKRKHQRGGAGGNSANIREYNSLPRGASVTTSRPPSAAAAAAASPERVRRRDASLTSNYSRRNNDSASDYRVTSLHEKNAPGKLADFVPEADRRGDADQGAKFRGNDAPKTIRNFQFSAENVATTRVNYEGERNGQEESTQATLKRSTLPRNTNSQSGWKNEYTSEENENEQQVQLNSMSNHHHHHQHRSTTPLRSVLKNQSHNYYRNPSADNLGGLTDSSSEDELIEEEEIHRRRHHHHQKKSFHTVRSYGSTPPACDDDVITRRSRSAGGGRRRADDVSRVTHRFYDRDGNHVQDYGNNRSIAVHQHQSRRQRSTDIAIRREYSREREESRDWRDVINQQRQPAPGYHMDRRGIAATSASLSNLPTYINRRLEQQRERERGVEYGSYSNPTHQHQQHYFNTSSGGGGVEKYERDEWSRVEERTPAPAPRSTTTIHREQHQQHREDTVVAVSGKHRCAHCSEELGRGAAMIVESLNLFYHLACFKCYVCKTSLGSGATGADVRVRDGRLHCQTCYSNDRVQLSKV